MRGQRAGPRDQGLEEVEAVILHPPVRQRGAHSGSGARQLAAAAAWRRDRHGRGGGGCRASSVGGCRRGGGGHGGLQGTGMWAGTRLWDHKRQVAEDMARRA